MHERANDCSLEKKTMHYTRVLGAVGLVAGTVLGAFGPGATSHAANSVAPHPTGRVSHGTAIANLKTALKTGYMLSANGHLVPLSSALRNFAFSATVSGKATGKASASGFADASIPPQPLNGMQQANQDFGYYDTGNGQLFHNTESVAVDPLSPGHIVVGATDTRMGSEGNSFNFGSNPSGNGAFNPGSLSPINQGDCLAAQITGPTGAANLTCDLIESLGGPGIYDSVDGGRTFSDLIIPDMLSGAVPDALLPLTSVPAAITSTVVYSGTQVGCLSDTIMGNNAFNIPGSPNGCIPYDSVGDQSVAFDAAGNLYSASLGIINNPPYGTGVGLTPQTDVVINVSPAVQPLGASALAAVTSSFGFGPALTQAPMAAGRFFNTPPASTTCNVFQSSTQLCLHNEVVASNEPANFIGTTAMSPTTTFNGSMMPITGNVSLTATIVGRNFQADANNPVAGALGPGNCGISDVCLIDSPYLAIDSTRNEAYLTYTVIDFNTSSSNVYLMTSTGLASPGLGILPAWNPPVPVDNGFGNGYCSNPYNTNFGSTACTSSWGAQPAVGPDGTVYVAYENADISPTLGEPFNQILVAYGYSTANGVGQGTYQATGNSGFVYDHDQYTYQSCPSASLSVTCASGSYAALDAESGAYFTIPNRPSIAVTGPTSTYPYGVAVVVYTTQGGATMSPAVGTRIDFSAFAITGKGTVGTVTSRGPIVPTNSTKSVLLSATTTAVAGPADVYPQTATVNQFFPWVAASQAILPPIVARTTSDAVYVGFYQETPGTATISPDGNSSTSTATLSYLAARSTDLGATWGVRAIDTAMPLPNPPASEAYGDFLAGGSPAGSPQADFAYWNAVPYFGSYTGAAWDNGNGAYLSWTDTRGNAHDFGVGGSQNVEVVHVG
jgi:hypothetical protein